MRHTILALLIRPLFFFEFLLGVAMFFLSGYCLATYTEGNANVAFTSLATLVGRWPYLFGLVFGPIAMWHACRKAQGGI